MRLSKETWQILVIMKTSPKTPKTFILYNIQTEFLYVVLLSFSILLPFYGYQKRIVTENNI